MKNYNAVPIHLYKVWLGNQRKPGPPLRAVRVVSERLDKGGDIGRSVIRGREAFRDTVEADFGAVDRGTFTPPG